MAQTKKKRRTKHRGNAAGMVEARGRTGRKPTASERNLDSKAKARQERLDRLNAPPTWRGSINRAAIATIFFVVAMLLLFHAGTAVIGLAGFVFLIYIPLGYYTDLLLYRRRQARKQAKGEK